jgi:hypothetical protein
MTQIGLVRQVSGEWNRAQGLVRLRIEADNVDQPQDVLIAPEDLQALVRLLLVLSGKAGLEAEFAPPTEARTIQPLPLDSVALGETDDGGTVLELNVGQTALAFFLPTSACTKLGQTLLAVSASRSQLAN